MGKEPWISSSEELDITWSEKIKFQSVEFYSCQKQYSDKISELFSNSDTDGMIFLSWYGYAPGTAISMSFEALTIPSEERLYFWITDFMAPKLLAMTKDLQDEKVDYFFLQKLFCSNGFDFNAQIFDFPADSITIGIQSSWDFVVDIILKAFDAGDCWGKLLGRYEDLWIEDYENPPLNRFMDPGGEEMLNGELRKMFKEKHEDPTCYAAAVSYQVKQRSFIEIHLDAYVRDMLPDFRFNNIPGENNWGTTENKWRIVERYLNKVI